MAYTPESRWKLTTLSDDGLVVRSAANPYALVRIAAALAGASPETQFWMTRHGMDRTKWLERQINKNTIELRIPLKRILPGQITR